MRVRFVAVVLLSLLCAFAVVAQESARVPDGRDDVPLRNWPVAFSTHPASANALVPQTEALPSAASHFIEMAPCRVYDSRVAAGGPGPIPSATSRTIPISGGPCPGIPTTAAGFSLNLVATNSPAGSTYAFLTAYPTGTTRPNASTLNFMSGAQVGNAAIVPAGTSGSIDIYVSLQSEVIIDINGYFVEGVVTNIVPGSGLSGGGTGNVDLSIATAGITNAHIDPGAGIEESKLALSHPTHTNANDPTANEKAALGGTSGAPGAANRFVTDLDARNSNARTPLVHDSSAHDATVASRVGGVVPPAQLGTGPTASTFLQGDGAFAVPAAIRIASWGMAPKTITTTATELKSFSATFPADGAALFLFSAQFDNPGGLFPPGWVSCTLWEATTAIRSWTWDPGDGDGNMDQEQTAFTNRWVTAGSHTYSIKCSTNSSQAEAQMGDVVVLFFRASI